MPLLKAAQVRQLTKDERAAKLLELQNELLIERGKIGAMAGGRSAGRVKSLRKEVARVLTVMQELNEA
jgi:large subunit ribosomal protein L29